jgi:hypothetical protein
MQLYAGLDLHSRNTYIGIMDKKFKRVFGKRMTNKLPVILETLAPFQDRVKGIVPNPPIKEEHIALSAQANLDTIRFLSQRPAFALVLPEKIDFGPL